MSSIEQLISDELRAQVEAAVPPPDAWDRFVASIEPPGTRMFDVDSGDADVNEVRGDDLMVDYLQHRPDASTAPNEQRGWFGVVIAVAATILVVVGVVVVADGNSGDVVTDPASSPSADDAVLLPSVDDPVASPTVTVPPVAAEDVVPEPELADRRSCEGQRSGVARRSFGWLQVCEAAGSDRAVMYAVVAGGPGLVAVGGDDEGCCSDDPHFYGYPCDGCEAWDVSAISDAIVWTSPDGFTWSRVPHDEAVFGGNGAQQMFGVVVGGPGLVAVGRDGLGVDGNGSAAVWTSPDGLTWSRVPHDEDVFGGPGEQRMVSVTVGGPGLVAVGRDGLGVDGNGSAAVWTSVDGLTWSRVPHDATVFGGESRQRMLSVTAGGPGLVAVGSDGHPETREHDDRIDELAADASVWTSVDGLTWTRVPHDEEDFGGPGEQRMDGVTVGGPGLVAVGSTIRDGWYAAAVWTSPDGLTWSRVPDEAGFAVSVNGEGPLLSVTAGGPGLVAVGMTGFTQLWREAVWTSPDGLTWSQLPAPCCGYERMLSVTVGGPGLVAVGSEADQNAAVWVTSLEN